MVSRTSTVHTDTACFQTTSTPSEATFQGLTALSAGMILQHSIRARVHRVVQQPAFIQPPRLRDAQPPLRAARALLWRELREWVVERLHKVHVAGSPRLRLRLLSPARGGARHGPWAVRIVAALDVLGGRRCGVVRESLQLALLDLQLLLKILG